MTTHHLLLILHLLAAAVWVGGHLVLSVSFLPEALQKKDPKII
ncbi:Copper resistance protein CopD [Flavobacterium antarcticum]